MCIPLPSIACSNARNSPHSKWATAGASTWARSMSGGSRARPAMESGRTRIVAGNHTRSIDRPPAVHRVNAGLRRLGVTIDIGRAPAGDGSHCSRRGRYISPPENRFNCGQAVISKPQAVALSAKLDGRPSGSFSVLWFGAKAQLRSSGAVSSGRCGRAGRPGARQPGACR